MRENSGLNRSNGGEDGGISTSFSSFYRRSDFTGCFFDNIRRKPYKQQHLIIGADELMSNCRCYVRAGHCVTRRILSQFAYELCFDLLVDDRRDRGGNCNPY